MVLVVTFAKLLVALQALAHPRLALKLGAFAAEKTLLLVVSCPLVAAVMALAVVTVLAAARAGRDPGGSSAGPAA